MAKVKFPPMVQVDSFSMLDAMGDVVCSGKPDVNKDGLCENSEYGVCIASGADASWNSLLVLHPEKHQKENGWIEKCVKV